MLHTIKGTSMAKQERFQLVIPLWLKERIKQVSEEKGISMSEAIKDILKKGLG